MNARLLGYGRLGALAVCATLCVTQAGAQALKPAKGDPYWTSSGAWGQKHRDQRGLERIGWTPQLAQQAKSPVAVAVIDTGLDYYHKDLSSDRIFHNTKE